MDEFEFYLNWYNKEEERKNALENSLNIPIGILTILYALQFYLVKEFNFKIAEPFTLALIILFIGISFASAIVTTYYLLKSYHNIYNGFNYQGFPYPSSLLIHKNQLKEYYSNNQVYFPGIDGEDVYNEYLLNKLVTYIDQNAFNNDTKSKAIHSSKRYLFISILTIILAFLPFLSNIFKEPEKIYKIEMSSSESFNNRLLKLEDYARRTSTTKTPSTATTTSRQVYSGRQRSNSSTNATTTTTAPSESTKRKIGGNVK